MVNNHHILSQVAQQRATDIQREVGAASAKATGEPARSPRPRFHRSARTPLVAVKETGR